MPRRQLAILTVACVYGCAATTPEKTTLLNPATGEAVGSANGMKPSQPIMPETYVAAGKFLERQGDLTGAITQYQKAIDANPGLAEAYNAQAIAYQTLGQFRLAAKVLDEGIRAAPNSASLRNNAGLYHAMQGHIQEAEDQFRDALDLDPDFEKARGNLAILLARDNRLGESFQEFRRVVSPANAYTNVAIIRFEQADYDSAASLFREALKIDPDCRAAVDGLEKASRFSKTPPPPAVSNATKPQAVQDAPAQPAEANQSVTEADLQIEPNEVADNDVADTAVKVEQAIVAVKTPAMNEQPITIEDIFPADAIPDPPVSHIERVVQSGRTSPSGSIGVPPVQTQSDLAAREIASDGAQAPVDNSIAIIQEQQPEAAPSQDVPTIPAWPVLTLAAMAFAAFVTYISPGSRRKRGVA